MKTKIILSIGLAALLSACGGGGGGGSSSPSSSGHASGPLSVPNATCAGGACIGGASLMANDIHPSALTSGETVFHFADLVYTHFTETVIPGVNAALYKVERVAAENGLSTCQDIEAVTAGMLQYPLGDGYTVDTSDLTGDLRTIPAPMTGAGGKMAKRFIFSNSGTKFAEVQIKCQATERTLYVRVQESASKLYEFWSQNDGNKRVIYGAMDNGSSQKTTFYFNTADGSAFQLHGVARQVVVAGATMDFSIAGGANLSTGAADIAYVQDDSVPTSASYSDDDSGMVQPRHCYSSISPVTVVPAAGAAMACSGLLGSAGAADAVRAGTAWKLTGMASAIDTSF